MTFHEVREDAGVGREAGEGDAEVGVEVDYLLLVGGEVFGISLQWVSIESSGRLGEKAWTFRATRTTCVLLQRPTVTEPCLTASDAYSIWKMRPCGEL